MLRQRDSIKEWSKLGWHKGGIPKHMINMWIANYNRLPTRSRLPDWGLQVPIICHFYSQLEETRDHQLLQCGFSFDVWMLSIGRLSQPLNLFNSWLELLSWIKATSTQAPTTLRFCHLISY